MAEDVVGPPRDPGESVSIRTDRLPVRRAATTGTEDRNRLPRGWLAFAERPRHRLESADESVPGARLSRVGGYPIWRLGAAYPRCPGCERPMLFVAQLSNEDLPDPSWDLPGQPGAPADGAVLFRALGEVAFRASIRYLFLCPGCGAAATSHQNDLA